MTPSESRAALDGTAPEVYAELRRLARYYLSGERQSHTLQPTALVHEAYLRLAGQHSADWNNRAQFVGLAAQMMRRVLVNHARDRRALKRDATLMVDATQCSGTKADAVDVLDLSRALDRLGSLDPQQERVVELRFFGGLSIEETAELLDLSATTIKRDWSTARLFLLRQLRSGDNGDAGPVA